MGVGEASVSMSTEEFGRSPLPSSQSDNAAIEAEDAAPVQPASSAASEPTSILRKASFLRRKNSSKGDIEMEKLGGRDRAQSTSPAIKLPDVVLTLRARLQKKKQLKDLFTYLMLVVLFMIQLFLARDVGASNQVHFAMRDVLIAEEFPEPFSHVMKSYGDIGSIEEFWQWTQGPLETAIVDAVDSGEDVIYQYNRIVGAVRFRQLRVRSDRCSVDSIYDEISTQGCFPSYSTATRDKRPFGPNDEYEWRSADRLDTPTEFGRASYVIYDGSGHAADIRVGADIGDAFETLRNSSWIDSGTRAVFVTVNTFNANFQHFTLLKMVVEFTPGGGIYPWIKFKTFRLHPYLNPTDFFRATVEVALVALVLYFISVEVREYLEQVRAGNGRFAYFSDPWNLLDIANLSIFLIVILLNIAYLVHPARGRADFSSERYLGLDDVATDYTEIFDTNAANVLLTFIKIFKFLKVNPRMLLMWNTLGKASPDLLAFFLFFLIVFMGFAIMGHLLFGPDLWAFRDFLGSVTACANMIVGEFDYPALHGVHRVLGPMFFLFFILLVYFTLANMLLAIINDAFSVVKRETQHSSDLGRQIRKGLQRKLQRVKTILARRKTLTEDQLLIRLTESDLANRDEVSLRDVKGILGDSATEEQAQKLLHLSKKGTMMRLKADSLKAEEDDSKDDGQTSTASSDRGGKGKASAWSKARSVMQGAGRPDDGAQASTSAASAPAAAGPDDNDSADAVGDAPQLAKRVQALEGKVDEMIMLLRAMGETMTAKIEEEEVFQALEADDILTSTPRDAKEEEEPPGDRLV